jgi:alpha/beta superfamily hydrolase
MSKTESSAVVVPTTEGKPDMGQAAGVAKMKGGALVLTPLPLSGGRRKTRKISKKVLKTLKKMGTKKVMKMLRKGGQAAESMMTEEPAPATTGARRKSRSRRGLFHY